MGVGRAMGRILFGRILPKGIAYPVLAGPLGGMRFILGGGRTGRGASVYFNLVEPAQTIKFVATLRPGQVFFDVGANVGYYSLIASRVLGAAGRIIAFEPVPENLEHLTHHRRMNRASNIEILAAACSDLTGVLAFERGENDSLGRLNNSGLESGGERFWVPSLRLDDFVDRTGLLPHVMKIDVEGAEARVIAGAERMLRRAAHHIPLDARGRSKNGEPLRP